MVYCIYHLRDSAAGTNIEHTLRSRALRRTPVSLNTLKSLKSLDLLVWYYIIEYLIFPLWGDNQPSPISIRTTMTTLLSVIPEVSAYVEGAFYIGVAVLMSIAVLKGTE